MPPPSFETVANGTACLSLDEFSALLSELEPHDLQLVIQRIAGLVLVFISETGEPEPPPRLN